MEQSAFIQTLHASLRDAVERRVIREWSVRGRNVVLHRGSVELMVPIMEATEYVNGLLQQDDGSEVSGT